MLVCVGNPEGVGACVIDVRGQFSMLVVRCLLTFVLRQDLTFIHRQGLKIYCVGRARC